MKCMFIRNILDDVTYSAAVQTYGHELVFLQGSDTNQRASFVREWLPYSDAVIGKAESGT